MNANPLLVLNAIQASGALVIFGLCYWRIRARRQVESGRSLPRHSAFYVFSKNDQRAAIRGKGSVSLFAGLLYVIAMYWALPVLIWRYGLSMALCLVLFPIGGALALTYLLTTIVEDQSAQLPTLGIGLLIGMLLRGAVGIFVCTRDASLQRKIRERRGWVLTGTCEAKSGRDAIKAFRLAPA